MAKKAGLPIKKAEGKPVPVKIVHDEATEPMRDEARERKWKAEDALRDIERAEGHKRDRSLMKDVKSLAKEKVKSLNKIC
jgi:hypothetical protein